MRHKQLNQFYRSLKARAPADFKLYSGLYGPNLIWLHDEYLKSKRRIAVIGQQVLSWGYNYPRFIKKLPISEAIEEHREFDFAQQDGYRHLLRSPFWKFFYEVADHAFPNEAKNYRKVLWTNLVKFVGRSGQSLIDKAFTKAEPAIQLQEDVLPTELAIAKPDVCIFVTGPDFDCLLRRYFRGLRFEKIDLFHERKLARLVHRQLPFHSYRTYHPNHLSHEPRLRNRVMDYLLKKF